MSKRLNEAARMLGRKGGRTAARNMTKQQRRERALRGTRSRWGKQTDADLLRLLPLMRDPDKTASVTPQAPPGASLADTSQAEMARA